MSRPVNFVCCSRIFCKTNFFHAIFFRSKLWNRISECLGMGTFFRGITEVVPSLFRGIFSERNSAANPNRLSWPLIYFLSTHMVTMVLKTRHNRQKFYISKMLLISRLFVDYLLSIHSRIFWWFIALCFWFDKSNRQLGNFRYFWKSCFF